jgi:hypothetical protein
LKFFPPPKIFSAIKDESEECGARYGDKRKRVNSTPSGC